MELVLISTSQSYTPTHSPNQCIRRRCYITQSTRSSKPDYSEKNNSNMKSHIFGLLLQCDTIHDLKQIHSNMLANDLEITQNPMVSTKLVQMYGMHGSLERARQVFDKMPEPNIFLWNAMIRAYAKGNWCEETLSLYHQMRWSGTKPDNYTFPFVLKACAGLSGLQEGKEIHSHVLRSGFESDVFVMTALIDMYAKCRKVKSARQVFDKMPERGVVSWNAMIAGYVQNGNPMEALRLLYQMQLVGNKPNPVTMVTVLSAFSSSTTLQQQGKAVHAYVIRNEFEWHVSLMNALMVFYVKFGDVDKAHQLFYKMPKRDVVSWTTLLGGYVQNGYSVEALRLFHKMQLAGTVPNAITLSSLLPAYANLAASQQGKWMHSYIIKSGFESDLSVGNALVDMYAKCGNVEVAREVFDKMSMRDVVSWNTMIAGYGIHGKGESALVLFRQMQQKGIEPNNITFVSVLSACSHAGLVDEGFQLFDSMTRDYCIAPGLEHYGCMVDLLGRAGCLDKAVDFIKKMPLEPDAYVWGALLGACRIHQNVELGMYVSQRLLQLVPKDGVIYANLANMYATAGKWNDVSKVRSRLRDVDLKKSSGCSWIEINNKIHTFHVGDRSHPQWEQIHALLNSLVGPMKEAGYVPDTSTIVHPLEEDLRQDIP